MIKNVTDCSGYRQKIFTFFMAKLDRWMVCQIAMEISIYEGFWDQNCERQMFVGGYTYQLHSEVDFGVVF